jgi:hypothetical protein
MEYEVSVNTNNFLSFLFLDYIEDRGKSTVEKRRLKMIHSTYELIFFKVTSKENNLRMLS